MEKDNISIGITPKEDIHFKFPPDIFLTSNDSVSDCSANVRSRRSFTPSAIDQNIRSPDISPIDYFAKPTPLVRLPPAKVKRAIADSTNSTDDLSFAKASANMVRSGGITNEVVNTHRLCPAHKIHKGRSNYNHVGIKRQCKCAPNPNNILNERFSLDMILLRSGLYKYMDIFFLNKIELRSFLSLNNANLIELGIKDENDRVKMLKVIKKFGIEINQ